MWWTGGAAADRSASISSAAGCAKPTVASICSTVLVYVYRHTREIAGSTVFDDAADFSEGLAAVLIGKTWGYADQNLSVLIAPRFQTASAFSEGLAAVLGVDGFSYIDGAGSVIIAGPLESADEFHEGVAVVYRTKAPGTLTGQDSSVPGVYAHAGRFFHGRANVQFIDGTLAYIDRTGRVLYRWKSR